MFEFSFEIYEVSKENLVDYLGTILVLILFIIERVLNGRNQKKDSERNWYLNVIVQPNLEELKSFFKNYKRVTIESFKYLYSFTPEKNNKVFLNIKSKEFDRIKDLRRGEIETFLLLINSFDVDLYSSLSTVIRDMEDWIIKKADEELDIEEVLYDFEDEYSFIVNEFMKHLYKPI
ncbi:MAG: hypothetical protein ABJH08_12710 [Balneola sp.]